MHSRSFNSYAASCLYRSTRLVLLACLMAGAIAVTGCSTSRSASNRDQIWRLTVPESARGLTLDRNAGSSRALEGFKPVISKLNSQMKGFGHVTSVVFGVYGLRLPNDQANASLGVIFAGGNGTFNPRKIVAKLLVSAVPYKAVPPGPHGGEAVCTTRSTTSFQPFNDCAWVTPTTFANLIITGRRASTINLRALMVKIRDAVEVPNQP